MIQTEKTNQTFVFIHDQDLLLEFEKNNKFKTLKNYTYVFLGSRDTSKLKDVKNLLPRICQLSKITPFHEETIYNVLTWKINPNHNGLPMSYINVESSSTVKHFLSKD